MQLKILLYNLPWICCRCVVQLVVRLIAMLWIYCELIVVNLWWICCAACCATCRNVVDSLLKEKFEVVTGSVRQSRFDRCLYSAVLTVYSALSATRVHSRHTRVHCMDSEASEA